MFYNFVSVIGVVLVTTIGATVLAPASSQERKHFATTYLNGQSQRLTLGSNQTEWSAPIDHPMRKEILNIAIQNNACVSLMSILLVIANQDPSLLWST